MQSQRRHFEELSGKFIHNLDVFEEIYTDSDYKNWLDALDKYIFLRNLYNHTVI